MDSRKSGGPYILYNSIACEEEPEPEEEAILGIF